MSRVPLIRNVPGARYSVRLSSTMWGRRLVLWDNEADVRMDPNLHCWPCTARGARDAEAEAMRLSLSLTS